MTKILTSIILCLALFQAEIQAQRSGLGLGMLVGEPSAGISLKYWVGGDRALDAALAWSTKGNAIYLHGDYLYHFFDIIRMDPGSLAFYVGPGARVIIADDPVFGGRIALGLNYLFDGPPLDIFLELAPVLNVLPGTDFDLNGALGVRYFF